MNLLENLLKLFKKLSILLLFFGVNVNSIANTLDQYKLSADDVVSVIVFDEPDLSLKETRVSSTGTISMPLIGQIILKGLTVAEAEAAITSKFLDGYLKKPDITLTIIEYRQFYVNGQIAKPGGYSYREGMTVQRAITLAGGFTERASRNDITLVRENTDGRPMKVDLSSSVRPGDVITVDESFF